MLFLKDWANILAIGACYLLAGIFEVVLLPLDLWATLRQRCAKGGR